MRSFKDICGQGGVNVLLHRESHGEKCPCFNETMGGKSLQWHRDNPDEQECGPDGYLAGSTEETGFKAFVEPASKKSPQLIQRIFGEIKAHDMFYIGPADVEIKGLNRLTDYLLYGEEKFEFINPELLYFMGAPHHYEAGLRKRD